MYSESMFLGQNVKICKNIIIFHLNKIFFTAVKNRSILHRHVIVMEFFLPGTCKT